MATPDKLSRLQDVPLFRACSKGELRTIGRLAEEIQVPASKTLVRQGATGREFFLIVEGEAKVEIDGREVAVLGPGSFFGELALLSREPRDASVTTLTPARLLVIGQKDFANLVTQSPTMARKLLEGMARRLRALDQQSLSA